MKTHVIKVYEEDYTELLRYLGHEGNLSMADCVRYIMSIATPGLYSEMSYDKPKS